MSNYKVIRDTREKSGWEFDDQYCSEVISGTLKTGDYTIAGFEDSLCIERKATVLEIAGNLGSNYKRFMKEIDRMKQFKHAYVICEFSLDELLRYPYCSGISKSLIQKIRINGYFLLSRILDIELNHGIHFIFCDNRKNAMFVTTRIFRKLCLQKNTE